MNLHEIIKQDVYDPTNNPIDSSIKSLLESDMSEKDILDFKIKLLFLLLHSNDNGNNNKLSDEFESKFNKIHKQLKGIKSSIDELPTKKKYEKLLKELDKRFPNFTKMNQWHGYMLGKYYYSNFLDGIPNPYQTELRNDLADLDKMLNLFGEYNIADNKQPVIEV